nr:hypothetical protein [uncultured Blautia sp.]
MNKMNSKTKQKKNQGFSLITVILAVSFIGILSMLMLYLAVSNFFMKTTDLKGKNSFYTAERALEEIKTGLQQDIGDAMSKAYIHVLETYDKNSASKDVVQDEERQKEFQNGFIEKLAESLQKSGGSGSEYSLEHLKSYLDLTDSDKYDPDKETLIVTTPAGSDPVLKKSQKDGILLENLKVIYVDAKGLASVIETDIRLGIPEVQFPTPSTLPDLMNMIVVAEGGLICDADVTKASTIQGSIYAGLLKGADNPDGDSRTSILLKPGASLEITRGDKVVGAGEIKVGEGGTFTSDAGVTLWAQGARLSSATVNLLGTTYFADDLTVESGKNSNVTIRGNYYGYGSAGSARADSCRNAGTLYTNWTDAAISSAIVINGKNTTMDLSGVEKLMLAGKNYIGTSRIASGNSGAGNSDVMTGESLTVKGTQLAYLFPVELFDLGSGALGGNPVSYDEYSQSGLMGQTELPVKWDEPVESWGGKTLRQIGVNQNQPVQEVFYNDNSGGGSVYFYLNFSDSSSAAAFMDSYYSSNPRIKSNMDQYLSFYFAGENSGIRMGETDNYLRYVTNGNILTYDGETASGDLMDATDAEASRKLVQEQINYQNTWYALNRKMITSVDLLNTKMEDSEGIIHDETDSGRSVFDNLVNEKEMVRYLYEKHPNDLSCEFTAGEEDDGLTAIICHNGVSSTYEEKASDGSTKKTTVPGTGRTLEITQAMADKLRLVLCTGDVKIDEGVQFRGIIMAKGKLTLEPGAKLEAASLEAARVFQSVTVNEDIAPQQFFWEGDKYVLGNTSAEDVGNGTGKLSDSYDLSGYVTYENWKKE